MTYIYNLKNGNSYISDCEIVDAWKRVIWVELIIFDAVNGHCRKR